MADRHANAPCPAATGVTRRNIVLGLPAAAVAMAAGGNPVRAQAEPATVAEQVMHHVHEIERLLMAAAPEGVFLRSFRWGPQDDDFIVHAIWENPDNAWDCRPAHFRPRYRPGWWVQDPPVIAGAS